MIRPITGPHGIGFCSDEQQPKFTKLYREENLGRYWNYYVTTAHQEWPEHYEVRDNYVIDGFSPNLNKSLHAGHLRQLAVANSLKGLLNYGPKKAKFVSILGASQGVYKYATDALQGWFDFLEYKPEVYYDVLMPRDETIVPRRKVDDPDNKLHGCEIWDGPADPVIVVRADGRPTYAFHDIAFAKVVSPTHYVTGAEQREHFINLGLGDKHLSMGLILGADGKKLKSRGGSDEAKAETIMEEVMGNLNECPEKRKLAWNVLAWNFLQVSRSQNVKYNPAEWTKTDAPGMYITYTYARVKKALTGIGWCHIPPHQMKCIKKGLGNEETYSAWDGQKEPDPVFDLTQDDADLIGFSNYYHYYRRRSVETMDSTQMATFTHDLARKLGKAYHKEKIQGGRYGFQYAVNYANFMLGRCLYSLGMFNLEQV